MTTASAPRGTIPPVAINVAVPGRTGIAGTVPGVRISAFNTSGFGCRSLARRVIGAHRKPVDAGAIEAGNIDIGDDSACQNAAERF